ncbi:MAG: DUF3048 domain-containing protein [Lachnospiraceae bacterium]
MNRKAFAAIVLGLTLTGCSGKQYIAVSADEAESESADIVIEVETEPISIIIETEAFISDEPEERIEQDGKIRSYLTGEMVDVNQANRRPLAIMMSNDKAALPQYGINRAGVVYEAPVEGVMNRYLAIIEDYDMLERIGSVRSCRTYYIYFAREFEAIYAHYGQSTFAKPYLQGIENINGIEGTGGLAYFRSKDRKSPHNAYASYTGIQNAIGQLGYSQEYDPAYQGHFQFARTGAPVELSGDDVFGAYQVTPGYQYNEPWFVYQEDDGLYYRFQYGAAHNGDEGQIAVKNIIIQYCAAGYYATTDYRNINVHDGITGYYITEGKARPITWEKDGEFGTTHYYDSEGNEITLNQGKTWVCVMTGDAIGKEQFQENQ